MAKKVSIDDRVERRTQEIGEELFGRLQQRSPSVFHGRWWEDRLLNWAMSDEAIRVQLYRFVDVLPVLRDHQSIARHLDEYFDHVKERLPWAARLGLNLSTSNSILSRALAFNARSNAARMARRFVAGESSETVLNSIEELRRRGIAFTLSHRGPVVLSEVEADEYQASYLRMMDELAEPTSEWGEVPMLDQSAQTALPRLHFTINVASLDSQFSTTDPKGSTTRVLKRLRPVLRQAMEQDAHLCFKSSDAASRQLTLAIVQKLLMEKDFKHYEHAGIALAASEIDCEAQVKKLLAWVKKRKTPIAVRLSKGDRWDAERRQAVSGNQQSPVYLQKSETDESFESCVRTLMKNYELLRPCLASHNLRSLSHALAWAQEYKVPDDGFEIQMLYGMGDEQVQVFSERGHRVRAYTPFGESVPGLARLVRHHLENPSSDAFLRRAFTDEADIQKLMMKPSEAEIKDADVQSAEGFTNEPLVDFSVDENRSEMVAALEAARDECGQTWPLVVDGKSSESRSTLTSRNPSNTSEVLGYVASASLDQASDAIEAARRTTTQWGSMETQNRCEYLELIAAEMRERRFELMAWLCLEAGKPWAEANADVAEAIDYCMYYAEQMRRLDEPQTNHFSGEENSYSYRPRGVAVVISPAGNPLSSLIGMTSAALVAGNTVVMKPAEQASIVAAKVMEMIRNAGVPDGVVNFVPGIGDDIGPTLVGSPDVDLVCFTGSWETGLEVNRLAAETDHRQLNVRHVIADMGGKNAIIVDEDADLDEAVQGVMQSAFEYSGQKCTSCSRVIVLPAVYEKFVERLVEATKSLKVGPAEDPATFMGPVIDEDAQEAVAAAAKSIDQEDGEELALQVDVKKLAKDGTFAGPVIITGVTATSNLAQDEFCGPVLAVMKVRTLDDAFVVANDSRYAMAGGFYSRSPANLKRARLEFEVGNLYLNGPITRAMVQRQPLGGYRMSGIGSKSGGPDSLLEFLIPISVTENTSRHGFTESETAEEVESAK